MWDRNVGIGSPGQRWFSPFHTALLGTTIYNMSPYAPYFVRCDSFITCTGYMVLFSPLQSYFQIRSVSQCILSFEVGNAWSRLFSLLGLSFSFLIQMQTNLLSLWIKTCLKWYLSKLKYCQVNTNPDLYKKLYLKRHYCNRRMLRP